MSGRVVLLDGHPVTLADRPLKSGGQAGVWKIEEDDGQVVKIYHDPPGPIQERRLKAMRKLSPLSDRPTHSTQPPELAWPTALAHGPEGEFLGYSMAEFAEPPHGSHVPMVGLFSKAHRLRHFAERGDWKFLLGVSFNLAFMTARMHHKHLIIGDFSSNNVVVDPKGFVTFLDCDSIAFTDPATGESFPCLMHTAEYCAPERNRGEPVSNATDDFALAVLIYQLLACGDHPFGGVPHDSDSEPSVGNNIARSLSYVLKPALVNVPKSTIDPQIMPPALLELATAAFGPGMENPAQRPQAVQWLDALDQERAKVRTCTAQPRHAYGSHLSACPWCERLAATGSDPFNPRVPAPRPSQPQPQPQPQPVPVPLPVRPATSGDRQVLLVIGVIAGIFFLLAVAGLLLTG